MYVFLDELKKKESTMNPSTIRRSVILERTPFFFYTTMLCLIVKRYGPMRIACPSSLWFD